MDYETYYFSMKEKLLVAGSGFGIVLLAAVLFYRSMWVMAAAAVFLPVWSRICRQYHVRRRKQELNRQFRECMQAVSGALLAGYSLENAWKEAEKDMGMLYGKSSDMWRELHYMNGQLSLQQPLEKMLRDFGERSGLDDVKSFCQVMQFAKRSGGNFTQIIASTVKRIGDKIEVMREIETVLAAKRMESGIMMIVPLAIIAYLTFCSPGYLDVLYGNPAGVLVMSGCLAVYVFGIWLSVKIVRGVEV